MRLDFNAEEVQPDSFEPLPPGEYPVIIIDSVEKETRAGNGSYLQITLEITDGPGKGRKVFDLLNLNNPSPKAVQIAEKQLSAICRAVGVMQPQDSAELHGIPMAAVLKIEKQDGYDPKNRVVTYKPLKAAAAVAASNEKKAAPPWGAKG